MLENEEINKRLNEIQAHLDREERKYIKKDFEFKLDHHNKLKETLEERDKIIANDKNLSEIFWPSIFINSDLGKDILPVDDNNEADSSWIRSLSVEYLKNYTCSVTFQIKENNYIKNSELTKKFSILDGSVEGTHVDWKTDVKQGIFLYFDNELENIEMFDILYELYLNAINYYAENEE